MIKSKTVESNFKLYGIRTEKMHINVEKIENITGSLEHQIELDYNIKDTNENDKEITTSLYLDVKVNGKVNETKIFQFYIILDGKFCAEKEKIPKEEFLKNVEIIGLATIIQHLRPLIFNATTMCGISPAVKLPMIDVQKLIEEKQKRNKK